MIAEVIVDISHSNIDKVFEYINDLHIPAGSRVLVPFGRQNVEGYIIKNKEIPDYDINKLKPITKALEDFAVISPEHLKLMEFMVERYNVKMVDAIRLFIPAEMRKDRVRQLTKSYVKINVGISIEDIYNIISPRAVAQRELAEYLYSAGDQEFETAYINNRFSPSALKALHIKGIVNIYEKEFRRIPYKGISKESESVKLKPEQQTAFERISSSSDKIFLLHGVTGSGKTEIYLHCIKKCVEENKTAIMLVPEISLTPQVLALFRERFGDSVAILHSGLSAGERFDEWLRLLSGEAVIAVGARSAIFAPLNNIGVIIIDEEHDPSYISENNPRYVTAEIAKFRRQYNGANLILGSATPSIESYFRAEQKEYELIELRKRINEKPLPSIKIVDMANEIRMGNRDIFSQELKEQLSKALREKNQSILFLNRRGYASYQMCRSCGYVAMCDSCDVSMVYHRDEGVLKCHYCNNRKRALTVCPQCGNEHIKQGNFGTQKVVEELKRLYPSARVIRMDNDTTRNKDAHLNIINQFAQGKADILVGTQMIAKGHDFPNVTLVGIIDADLSLYFSDYQSCERTYQLITQVAGRAGRDEKEGVVVLQTYAPKHYVYRFAVNNDYIGFYKKESNIRSVTKYPPFAVLVRILASSSSEERAIETLKNINDKIKAIDEQNKGAILFMKAMKAPIKKIMDKYRVQILMRLSVSKVDIILKQIYNVVNESINNEVNVFAELNPQNLN